MVAPVKPSWGRRIAAFPLTCMVAALVVLGAAGALAFPVLHLNPPGGDADPWHVLVPELILALGALAGQLLAGRFLERATLDELGWPRRALGPLAQGFAMGAALQGFVVGVLALAGWYTLAATNDAPAHARELLGALLMFFAAAVFEEVLMRGILFRQLERALGSWVAMALTAAFFGFAHHNNPGATPLSEAAISIEAGILLAAAYAFTRALWLPIGLHWAWDLFEGPIFGAAVSGHQGPHWLAAHIVGPERWTGGRFGPEAGLAAVISCTALGLAFVVLAVRRGRMVPPTWWKRGQRAS